jgi:hypothetical protein
VDLTLPISEKTMDAIGLGRRLPSQRTAAPQWDYQTLKNPPAQPDGKQLGPSLYRGIVPAKNILRRDFAINGAVVRRPVSAAYIILPLTENPTVRYKPRLLFRSHCTLDFIILPTRSDEASPYARRGLGKYGI